MVGGQIEVPDSNAGGRGRQPERFLVKGDLGLTLDLFGDIVSFSEDAGYLAIVIENRLVDEVQVAPL
jgi:hypothetical protein